MLGRLSSTRHISMARYGPNLRISPNIGLTWGRTGTQFPSRCLYQCLAMSRLQTTLPNWCRARSVPLSEALYYVLLYRGISSLRVRSGDPGYFNANVSHVSIAGRSDGSYLGALNPSKLQLEARPIGFSSSQQTRVNALLARTSNCYPGTKLPKVS